MTFLSSFVVKLDGRKATINYDSSFHFLSHDNQKLSPKVETKFLISSWPVLASCQHTFSCGQAWAILGDVGFYVFQWLLAVQHVWRRSSYSMVSTEDPINLIYFQLFPLTFRHFFPDSHNKTRKTYNMRKFPSFSHNSRFGDQINCRRPNNNVDTLLHRKDGNIVSICSFAFNGLWTLPNCGAGIRNEFQSSCRWVPRGEGTLAVMTLTWLEILTRKNGF